MEWILAFINPQELIMFVIIIGVPIILLRLLGAWMFRINDVIKHQKEILHELKKINSKE